MRTRALIVAAAMSILVVGPASPQDKTNPPPKERVDESVRRVRDLQRERIAALRQAAEVGFKLAQSDRLEVAEAADDRVSLLQAELEAAGKEADRITLYAKAVDELRAYEDVARAQYQAGRGTERAVHKVRARRLEVEIRLEQAKARGAKQDG